MQPLTSHVDGVLIPDEHTLLDDNKYVGDVLADFRVVKVPRLPPPL